ncbi:MAG: PaaI family thioesterase [Bacteroidales bacterium]
MKKLKNPFIELEDFNCFGCAPGNRHGLKLEFYEDGEYLITEWEPDVSFQGYGNILHGGIQTTLMDELASWVVYVKVKTGGVTASLDVKFKKSVFVNKGKVKVRAKLVSTDRKFAYIHAELMDNEDKICSEGNLKYFIFPEKVAREKLYYPGYQAFFE